MERWYNNKWFLLFIMIPFFKPICLQYFSGLLVVETIFVIWKMIGAFLIGLQLLNCFYYHLEIPRLVIAVSLFEGSILLSTIFHLGYLQRAVIDAGSIVAFVSFFVWALQVNGKVTRSLLGEILMLLMILNMMLII